jgi:hypothetical protein
MGKFWILRYLHIAMIRQNLVFYFGVILSYWAVYTVLEIIPIEVPMALVMLLGLVGMVALFSFIVRNSAFKPLKVYVIHLLFIIVFCTANLAFKVEDGQFYRSAISLNQAILLSTIIFLIYSIFSRKLIPILVNLLTVAVLIGYYWMQTR